MPANWPTEFGTCTPYPTTMVYLIGVVRRHRELHGDAAAHSARAGGVGHEGAEQIRGTAPTPRCSRHADARPRDRMIARAVEAVVIDIGARAIASIKSMPKGPPSRSAPAMVSTENCPLVTAWPSRTNSGTAATMREIAATATFCATHAVETVAPDTGVGHRALQIFASGTLIVTGLSTPSFQRMSQAKEWAGCR